MIASPILLILTSIWKRLDAASTVFDIVWLNDTNSDPLAVCNDGSSAAYYYSSALTTEFVDSWIIHLQGGGQCYSQSSCASRDKSLMSSKNFAPTISEHGIFDNDESKSNLWGYNKVYIAYCSSDGWIGDAPASDITWGYQFRGQRIIRATLDHLVRTQQLTASSKILFSGGSAGGRGMMNNVDFLSPYLPVGVTALGAFLDSAYTIDIEPYDPNFVGFRNETQEIYNRYNVSAIIPADCAAVYTGDEWKCTFGQYRMPFMKTPYVLIASNFDQYQLPYDIGMDPVNGTYTEDSANDYAMNWSNLTKSLLTDLSKYSYATNSYIHSWSCYNHDVSETSRYYQCTANGITQRIAVEKLLSFQSHGDVWIEECEGLFCGSGCDYLPTSLPTKQPSTHPVSKSPSQAPILKPTRHPTVTPASKKPSHHSTLIPISQSTVQVSVGTTKSLFKTDDIFTCVDFDYWPEDKCDFGSCQWLNNSVLSIDLSNPLLIDAVKSFGGNIRLRIGGTLADSVLYDIGSASSICQPFSSFNTSYRDGYAPFTGCLSMQRWDEINSFCIDVQCSLVFGINGLYGRTLPGPCPTETNCQISPYPDCCVNWTGKWDPSMTEDFFQYTLAKGYKIYAFEFGNELAGAKGIVSHIPVEVYAQDFITFSKLVRSTFSILGHQYIPKTITVDGNYDDQFTRDFLSLVGTDNIPDIFTWHIYSLGPGSDSKIGQYALDPNKLDKISTESQQVYNTVSEIAPTSRVWLGEACGAYDSGRDNVTNAFNSGFWFLDQMALMAANGHAAYCRQALAGGFYSLLDLNTFEPHPDYYSLLLYSRLMGPVVLTATSSSTATIRAYSYCTSVKGNVGQSPIGSVTVLLINLSNSTVYNVELSFDTLTPSEVRNLARQEYLVTSAGGPSVENILASKSVLLNGKLLSTGLGVDGSSSGKIPDLLPYEVSAGSDTSVSMPPLSYGFFVFPTAQASACMFL